MPPAPSTRTSCARAGFVHEEDSSLPTRRFQPRRSAAPTPPESPALFLSSFRPRLRNLVRKRPQLPLVEHGAIHHADQNLLDGAVAEPIDDVLYGFRRNPSAGLGRKVDIGPSIHRVGRIALVFQ